MVRLRSPNIIEAYPMLMKFIRNNLPYPFYLEGAQRIDLREIIFREVVINLLSHREYTDARPTTFTIYKDRVEIKNPNHPHGKGLINPDSFIPFPKNPIISRFMKELGWVDELGSGITNINKYLPHYGKGAKPSFNEDSMFTTIIPLTRNLSHKVHDKVVDKLWNKIIFIIEETPTITISEIAKTINKSVRAVAKNIKKLKDEGVLEREGSRKTGKWIINKDITNE